MGTVGSSNGNNKDINKSSQWGRNSSTEKEKEKESEATVVRPHHTKRITVTECEWHCTTTHTTTRPARLNNGQELNTAAPETGGRQWT